MPYRNTLIISTKSFSVNVAASDWNAVTKIATVSADWAVAGMSAVVTPAASSFALFKSAEVEGVNCIEILDGYLQFKTATNTVLTETIVMNVSASNDGQGIITNSAIVATKINGISIIDSGITSAVTENESTITAAAPIMEWDIPPYDENGHMIKTIGNGVAAAALPKIDNIIFGNNVTAIANKAFNGNTTLKKVRICKNVKNIGLVYGSAVFNGCTALEEFLIDDDREDLLTIQGGYPYTYSPFTNCSSLLNIKIPKNVYMHGYCFGRGAGLKTVRYESSYGLEGTFAECTALEELTFTQATPVSVTTPVTIFNSANYIYVPYDSLTAYSNAVNWASYASYLYGIGSFDEGETLPTQTTDGEWALTWYGTKEDLKAGTNAIIVAPSEFDNGYSEIYCAKTAVE